MNKTVFKMNKETKNSFYFPTSEAVLFPGNTVQIIKAKIPHEHGKYNKYIVCLELILTCKTWVNTVLRYNTRTFMFTRETYLTQDINFFVFTFQLHSHWFLQLLL